MKKPYLLRDMPDDIRELLLKEQKNARIKYNCMMSMERIMYKIIRKSAQNEVASEHIQEYE